MAQHDTQSKIAFPPRRLSTSSMSSTDSRRMHSPEAPAASVKFSNPFEKATPHHPNAIQVDKRNGNVMKAGYSKVKKSTSSMFRVKSRRSSGNTSISSLSEREQPTFLSELDVRLRILEQSERKNPLSPQGSPYSLLHSTAINKVSLTPQSTTLRWEGTPCPWQVPEQEDEFIYAEVQHSRPNPSGKKNGTDRLLLFLVAALIAIPNVALSWAPIAVTLTVGSAIAVLYGYRLAVVFPVLMLLNPASPIWRQCDARMKGQGVLVLGPKQSQRSAYRMAYSRGNSPHRKPIAPSRRHSTF